MSARITIQSGIAAGTSHRVEGRVARVGSDPQSDICLPTAEIPGHALTLEFRNDGCRVYNRCRDSVYIGARTVGPDQVVNWPETDILQLGDDLELVLDFDADDVSPTFQEDFDEPQAPHIEDRQPALPEKVSGAGKTIIQLAVTVLCLIGCVFLIARDRTKTVSSPVGPSFAEVVANSLESNTSPELIRRLQHAESQRIRGNEADAISAFARLRDDLVPQRNRFETNKQGSELNILRVVQTRLEQLSE